MTAGPLATQGGPAAYDYSYTPKALARPSILPPDAARLFAQISDDADDFNGTANASAERVTYERADLQRLRIALEQMRLRYGPDALNDKEYQRGLREVAIARERIENLAARQAEHQAHWQAAAGLRNRIAEWLSGLTDAYFVPWTGAAPKLGKGERPAIAVERCRALVSELKAEAAKVNRAPFTAAEAKAAARAYVAELAARARPDVSALFHGGTRPDFPEIPSLFAQPVTLSSLGDTYQGGTVRDATSMTAWLAPDLLIAALDAEIEAKADDKRAVSAEDKASRLADLAVKILAAERDEEAFLRMALDEGVQMGRRADADPQAVLQVQLTR